MTWPRSVAALLATVLCTAVAWIAAGLPATAAAPCDPKITATTVPDVITYAAHSTKIAASVTAVDPCSDGPGGQAGIATVEMGLPDSEFFPVRQSSGTPARGTWTTHLEFFRADRTGRSGLHIRVTDREGHIASTVRPFHVRRNTLITRNATPEPVRKGSAITVRGTLRRLTPTGRYAAFRASPVDILFRAAGTSAPVTMRTSTTSRFGSFATRFPATRDGTWYVRFRGTANYAAGTSVGDFVDVR